MSKNRNPTTRKDTSTKGKFVNKIKLKPPPRKGYLQGIYYESYTEYYALSWFLELKEAGYVSSIVRSNSFLLSDSIKNDYVIQQKRGSKPMSQTIAYGHSYTADFNVTFTKKSLMIFVWDIDSRLKYEKKWLVSHKTEKNEYLCYIEIKPDTDWRGANSKANNDGKWVFQKHNIFINMFQPVKNFGATFTPASYMITGTGKPRKINFETRSLIQYLK